MGRVRPNLGTPFGTDGPWLAAILDVLGDIADMLDARLPAAASADGGEPGGGQPVLVSEPAPERAPSRQTVPVSEPAPEQAPDDEEQTEPAQEPALAGEQSLPPPPPRRGRGSGLDAWQTFARAAGVPVADDVSRDEIIAACVDAGVIPAE